MKSNYSWFEIANDINEHNNYTDYYFLKNIICTLASGWKKIIYLLSSTSLWNKSLPYKHYKSGDLTASALKRHRI